MSEAGLVATVAGTRTRRGLHVAPRDLLGLAAGLAATGLVSLLALVHDIAPRIPALVLVLAVAAVALGVGLRAALLATGLSALPFLYLFTEPRNSFDRVGVEDSIALVLLLATEAAVAYLIVALRRTGVAAGAAALAAARLQRLTAELAGALSPDDVLEAVMTEGIRAADAVAAYIALLTPDGQSLEVVAYRGRDSPAVREYLRFPLDAPLPLAAAVRENVPIFLSSRAERDARFPALARVETDTHALVLLPVPIGEEIGGGIALTFAGDREFDPAERELKLTIARLAGQALERARLYAAAQRARERATFLAEASALLSSSLDYHATLARLSELAVPRLADWCTIDMLDDDGRIERLAVAHPDPEKVAWAKELRERRPPPPRDPDARYGIWHVLRTHEPAYYPEIGEELLAAAVEGDERLLEILRQLGLRSSITVPLVARDRAIGALTLIYAESGRRYEPEDVDLAQELAVRAAIAVDNARLFREAEWRGDASLALAYVADAVVLLDREGCVRYANAAAAALFERDGDDLRGQPAAEALPGWAAIAEHVAPIEAEVPGSTTVPVAAPRGERWVSASRVDFAEGSVYALRDITAEQELERRRSDFVATASHELRTPLAAVYGAARTLRRGDIELSADDRELFLAMIEDEADRLGTIVNQILLAGQLDAGTVRVTERPCDLVALAEDVLASARVRAPDNIRLELRRCDPVPAPRCDGDKLRQVLVNLVENAIKYSPGGGEVAVEVGGGGDGAARIAVSDEGLGIPAAERDRIFEKFYRLDPLQELGIGGTGLGLYISRELVERMGGRVTVESAPGRGSTFAVELPVGATG